jgi:hypothetical protein
VQSDRAAHEQAFRRLGGAPATVVLDNLREGVLQPDIHDPLQPAVPRCARALRRRRLAVPRPRPDRKGKVEAGIAHTQKAVRVRDRLIRELTRDCRRSPRLS